MPELWHRIPLLLLKTQFFDCCKNLSVKKFTHTHNPQHKSETDRVRESMNGTEQINERINEWKWIRRFKKNVFVPVQ